MSTSQIHTMSIEMKEMKGMLKLLVDTQMEMQRAIRQEVNAMMKSSTGTPILYKLHTAT